MLNEDSHRRGRQRRDDWLREQSQLTASQALPPDSRPLDGGHDDSKPSPPSSVLSSAWPSRSASPVSVVGRTSFDIIRETPLPASTTSSVDAVNVYNTANENAPLPPEPPSHYSGQIDRVNIKDIWNGSYRTDARYLVQRIKKVSEWLPHLRILAGKSGIQARPARVKSYQISPAEPSLEILDEFKVATASKWTQARDYFSRKPLKTGTERIILVEDLNPRVIQSLYAAFGIGPEMFAEHLNRSGYGLSKYTDPHPSTWNFRSSSKNYVSIRWYRPVYVTAVVDMPATAQLSFKKTHQATWQEKKWVELDLEKPRMGRLTHKLRRCTNIFRQERPLSSLVTDAEEAADRRALATIEERVTLYADERQDQRIRKSYTSGNMCTPLIRAVVALVDPLPYISYSYTTKIAGEDSMRSGNQRKLPVFPVHPRSPPPVSSVDELLHEEGDITNKTFFETPTSMLQDVEAWMTEYAHHSLPEDSEKAPPLFVAILEIVSRDTATVLALLTAALSEIALGSTDDSQEQERLGSWQMLIRSYQTDLPVMRDSLHEFTRWCFPNDVPYYVMRKVNDLTLQTDDLIERVEKAHQALRAELSILESKRGIAEAEGVTRLTELAFVFIPLTFSASLFSMQVKELEEHMPTLAGFVGACALFLGLSYGVRLAVRSHVLLDHKRQLFRRIRADSALISKDIPTRVFAMWLLKRFVPEGGVPQPWIFALFLTSAVLTAVLALIWTKSKIEKGLKTILTILLITLAFVVGLYAVLKRFRDYLKSVVDFEYFIIYLRKRIRGGEVEESERV